MRRNLYEQLRNYISGSVGQPEVSAHVPVCQLFVVETQTVQHGGVQIVNMDPVLGYVKSELVRIAEYHAGLNPAAGKQNGESFHKMISTDRLRGVRPAQFGY